MNTSGPQTTAAHPSSAESNCLPLPCAFGAAEASDSIGGGEQKKNSNIYVSTESGEVHTFTTSSLSASSSSLRFGIRRCVERAWPNTRHALRSLTPSRWRTYTTQRLRRSGLRSFPRRLPSRSACPASALPPPASAVGSPSRAP